MKSEYAQHFLSSCRLSGLPCLKGQSDIINFNAYLGWGVFFSFQTPPLFTIIAKATGGKFWNFNAVEGSSKNFSLMEKNTK